MQTAVKKKVAIDKWSASEGVSLPFGVSWIEKIPSLKGLGINGG